SSRSADDTLVGTWVAHPATWVVAVDVDSGARVAFGSAAAPPAHIRDAVRASWAIPGWFPPVEIGGRRYVDGGVFSPTSADLVAPLGLDEVVVVAPMASSNPGPRKGLGRVEGLVRRRMCRTLDAEVAILRDAGMRVLRIEPEGDDLEVMGPNFMDGARRLRVLESSLRTCRRTVSRALERDGFDRASRRGGAPLTFAQVKGA
ncbi:MAG TPA: patatin-like phospholipase family protein, partial [Labilithrix sp.]|nr:patatin-like phospholipase family protein [Labilithrix sp.]